MLKHCFNALILLRSSKKEFEKMSVDSTRRESIPKLVCFLFLFPPKALSTLVVQETMFFKSRVRTFFEKQGFYPSISKGFELFSLLFQEVK